MTSGRWTTDDLPDLTDRTAVVTGATSGLGLATAAALVDAGATVVLAVRDLDRGHAVEEALAPTARVRELDLADLDSVRHFAAQLHSEGEPIDILVNNAGVMAVPERRHGRRLDDLNWNRRRYRRWAAYCQCEAWRATSCMTPP